MQSFNDRLSLNTKLMRKALLRRNVQIKVCVQNKNKIVETHLIYTCIFHDKL